MSNAHDFNSVLGVVRHVKEVVVGGAQITKAEVMAVEKEDRINKAVDNEADTADHNKVVVVGINNVAATNKVGVMVISRELLVE